VPALQSPQRPAYSGCICWYGAKRCILKHGFALRLCEHIGEHDVTSKTRTLYRPVGLEEARLILETDATAFPPRLPHQPIFYPVLNVEYARQIARDWNTKSAPGFAGFVTEFDVDKRYLSRFKTQQVGASMHQELWVPAEQLSEFNEHIDGQIRFVEAYYGAGYQGLKHHVNQWYADEMLKRLYLTLLNSPGMDFNGEIARNRDAILLNFPYWLTLDTTPDIADEERREFLKTLAEFWRFKFPHLELAAKALLGLSDAQPPLQSK
jgi:hypothetical protein